MLTLDNQQLTSQAKASREASRLLATISRETKDRVLTDLAREVDGSHAAILEANQADMTAAAGLEPAKLRRLELTSQSLARLSAGLLQVAKLPDPIGTVTVERRMPNGLNVTKVRSPLGVVAMIYEARPAVTLDAFALCLKSGNACILKGGKESIRSSSLLAQLAHRVLHRNGLPLSILTSLCGLPREGLEHLLTLDTYIDLVIPRGGTPLIEFVCGHTRIPVVKHYHGICHIYIDQRADITQAIAICLDSKTTAPAACNAAECILIHEGAAAAVVPALVAALVERGVEVRGCKQTLTLARQQSAGAAGLVAASPEDFGREFLDLTMAMRVVKDLDEAIAHIGEFGSDHTDVILTRDEASSAAFVARVASSCTLVNASTRFNDGFELGLGAEIGISTSRVHAYGPMGLEELTTQRYVVRGEGQVRN